MKMSARKILIPAVVILTLAVLSVLLVMNFRNESYSVVTFHMDTFISYSIYGRKPQKLVEELEKTALRIEEAFDRFNKSSYISRINDNAGSMTEVDEQTYILMNDAVYFAQYTGGDFDPTVGVITDLWGFGRDPHVPEDADIEKALPYVDYLGISTDKIDGKYYVGIKKGQMLDLGAIAKGYCLKIFKETIERSKTSHSVISIGGNVLICDRRGEQVSVGIRCPEEDVLTSAFVLSLNEGVVSTSGSYERYFIEDGVRYSHIIDPDNGRSVSGELLSVSVICDDPIAADCLSTAYYVKGLDSVLDALASGKISGAAIDKDKVIYISADLMEKISEDSIANSYTLEVVG